MSNNASKSGFSKNTLIIGAVLAVIVIWAISAYNGMVKVEEQATTEWAKVQSAYQRRADLIPNLVNVVKGYASHEKETLEGVVNARAKATSITVDADDLTPEKLEQFQQAQGELSQALGKLLSARNSFNTAVQEYNLKIRKFPNTLLAGIFGFDKMAKFEADAAAQKAPEVQF